MKRYQYIDLFCGCGGLSLGFEQAGFIPRAGIDFKESAINTYRKHFKNRRRQTLGRIERILCYTSIWRCFCRT